MSWYYGQTISLHDVKTSIFGRVYSNNQLGDTGNFTTNYWSGSDNGTKNMGKFRDNYYKQYGNYNSYANPVYMYVRDYPNVNIWVSGPGIGYGALTTGSANTPALNIQAGNSQRIYALVQQYELYGGGGSAGHGGQWYGQGDGGGGLAGAYAIDLQGTDDLQGHVIYTQNARIWGGGGGGGGGAIGRESDDSIYALGGGGGGGGTAYGPGGGSGQGNYYPSASGGSAYAFSVGRGGYGWGYGGDGGYYGQAGQDGQAGGNFGRNQQLSSPGYGGPGGSGIGPPNMWNIINQGSQIT